MKKRKITLISLAALSLGALAFVYAPFGLTPNLGLPVGYYGEFNQMNKAIEKNDHLRVTDYGQHKDAYLEGFWISASTENGKDFTLDVGDSTKTRTPKKAAEGVVVFTGGYMNGVAIPNDSSFWESYEKEKPTNTDELLSQIDYFLERFEASSFKPQKLQFEESLDLIRIRI